MTRPQGPTQAVVVELGESDYDGAAASALAYLLVGGCPIDVRGSRRQAQLVADIRLVATPLWQLERATVTENQGIPA